MKTILDKEKECEWEVVCIPNNLSFYFTSCGMVTLDYLKCDKYCRFCGGKIKILNDWKSKF